MDEDETITGPYPPGPFDLGDDDHEIYAENLDALLVMVSPQAVADALKDFELAIVPGKDWDWLALAVRRSLGVTAIIHRRMHSSAEIRNNLDRLANLTEATCTELFQYHHSTENHLHNFAWNKAYQEREEAGEDYPIEVPPEYVRYRSAMNEVFWLVGFLRNARDATRHQMGPWRQSEEKRRRIIRGEFLAPIFESAFGKPVSTNNYPNDPRHKTPTAFMDFYQKMVRLAFGENSTPDLPGVLKASCQQHRAGPVTLVNGLIPEL